MATQVVYDDKGRQIVLIGTGRGGGEGMIYSIQGKHDECAKIYRPQKITKELYNKILAMVNNPPDDPMWSTKKHRSIAWPSTVLYKDSSKNHFTGFTMPLIDTKIFQEAHKYYDPSDRLRQFGGNFTWQHLFTTAYNITSAIAALHEKGHCIGDLRETNILVAPNTLVTLIDCDSFQIMDKESGRVYYTRVGTGEYLPSELMGVDFKGKDYNRYYSDLFALGVLIFKFLMNGVHPYQAKGSLVDDAPSTEEKIKKGYFAYGGKYRSVEPPDYAPPYDIILPSLQELFYKCFVDGHKEPRKRPSAKEWFGTLQTEGVRLKKCSANEKHRYSSHLSFCIWCKITKETGSDPFPNPFGLGQQIALADPTSSLASLDEKIDYIRSYIDMALVDGVLTSEEKDYITDIALKLQIPTNEIEKVVQEEIQKHHAQVVSSGSGTPTLQISKNYFKFYNIRVNSTASDTFTISNIGGGVLSGIIRSNKKWLKVSQTTIDTSRHKQAVTISVDTRGLGVGDHLKGVIEITSTGGNARIDVDLAIERLQERVKRFSIASTVIACAVSLAYLFFSKYSGGAIVVFIIAGFLCLMGVYGGHLLLILGGLALSLITCFPLPL